jgi:20S proteasome subunit beta 2
MELVKDAVSLGVYNDLGSGCSVDLCIIKKNHHEVIRGVHVVEANQGKKLDYTFKRGTSGVTRKFEIEIVNEEVLEVEKMEI